MPTPVSCMNPLVRPYVSPIPGGVSSENLTVGSSTWVRKSVLDGSPGSEGRSGPSGILTQAVAWQRGRTGGCHGAAAPASEEVVLGVTSRLGAISKRSRLCACRRASSTCWGEEPLAKMNPRYLDPSGRGRIFWPSLALIQNFPNTPSQTPCVMVVKSSVAAARPTEAPSPTRNGRSPTTRRSDTRRLKPIPARAARISTLEP